jgi:hypothetical protein
MKHLLLTTLLSLLLFSLLGCGDDSPTAPTGGTENTGIIDRFEEDFAADHWSKGRIPEGTTSITPEFGAADSLVFGYYVSLDGGGVTARSSTYELVAPQNGTVTVDWRYQGHHAWYQAFVRGRCYVGGPEGETALPLLDTDTVGAFDFSGTLTFDVSEGMAFGFELTGGNFDSNSFIRGNLTLHNFRFEPAESVED